MAQDIEKTVKDTARDFQFFSMAYDETTDITNTAQLAVFVHGITAEFDIREEMLSLQAMALRICLSKLFWLSTNLSCSLTS